MSDKTFTPPIFKKLGKNVSDLFKQKFSYNRQVKIRTNAANDVQITTTGTANKDGDFSGSVLGQYKPRDIGTIKAELSTSGATELTVEADKVARGFVFRGVANEAPKLTADVEYSQEMLATALNLEFSKNTTILGASGVVGYDGISVGGEAKFDSKANELSDFNVGVEYTQPDFTGTIKTREKADNLDVSWYNKVGSDTQVGGTASYNFLSRNWKLSGIVSHVLDTNTNVKAKADNTGVIAAVLEQRLANPNVLFRFSAEFNAKKASTLPEKFGLSAFFGEGYTDKD